MPPLTAVQTLDRSRLFRITALSERLDTTDGFTGDSNEMAVGELELDIS